MLDYIVVVARLALAHHHIATFQVDRFKPRKDALDIRRRDAAEQFGLQHPGHPVAVVFRFDRADFDIPGFADAIKRQQLVEQIATHAEQRAIADRARGKLSRLQLG